MRRNGFLWVLVFLFMTISLVAIFYIVYDKGYLNNIVKIEYLDRIIKDKEKQEKEKYDLNKIKINGDGSYMTFKNYEVKLDDLKMFIKLGYDNNVYICKDQIMNCNIINNVSNIEDIKQYQDDNNYIYYMLTDSGEVYKYTLLPNSYSALKVLELNNIKTIDEYLYCSSSDNCNKGILAIDNNNNYIYVVEKKITLE